MKYVVDASAMLAYFLDEKGGDIAGDYIRKCEQLDIKLYLTKFNWYETYYTLCRRIGGERAHELFAVVVQSPIEIIEEFHYFVFHEAVRLKVGYKMSLADAIGVATASIMDVPFITSDRGELDAVDRNESIEFVWIR